MTSNNDEAIPDFTVVILESGELYLSHKGAELPESAAVEVRLAEAIEWDGVHRDEVREFARQASHQLAQLMMDLMFSRLDDLEKKPT